jgi:hypothetical protein
LKIEKHGSRTRWPVVTGAFLLSGIAMASVPARSWADGPAVQAGAARARAATGVDGLIAHLHQELKITPAQEALFQKLADVMRENAETMSTLAKRRVDAAGTVTAVEDLKSYAEISEAHAAGAKKMITVFQPLYDSMSDDQKKAADAEFREHYATHHRHRAKS